MAIQVRQQQNKSNVVKAAIAAAALGAIVIAAVVGPARHDAEPSRGQWPLQPSVAIAPSASLRFAEEMALHESLTEAQFGELVASEASLAAAAIAEHDGLISPVVGARPGASTSVQPAAQAIAEHEALIEPFLPSMSASTRDDSAVIAQAIAEHDALIQPLVS